VRDRALTTRKMLLAALVSSSQHQTLTRNLSLVGKCCGVVLIVAIAFSLYGCNDVSSVSTPPPPPSPDSQLSSLTVPPGTLVPTFSGTTNSYTVDVTSDISSVTVTAQTQNSEATVSINGNKATTSQASQSVTLGGPGSSTQIPIVVTAPNGTQATYVVTVNRAALAGNNSLQSLTVSPGILAPAFDANTLNYSVNVGSSVSSLNVTAILQDANASMTVNGQATNSGQARTITLQGPGLSTLVTIVVTAPNLNQKTHTVLVNRAASSGNNNLSALVVSVGALTFDPAITSYSVVAPNEPADTTVTATVADSTATLTINGLAAISGVPSASIALIPGLNPPIFIVVTAQNGTPKTYIVTITVIRLIP
jgi:hypothetical protein